LLICPEGSSAFSKSKGTADLTTNPPSSGVTLATGNGFNNLVRGPDGCVYAAQGNSVVKITDAKGTCNYAIPSQPPSLVLAPPTISSNPEALSELGCQSGLRLGSQGTDCYDSPLPFTKGQGGAPDGSPDHEGVDAGKFVARRFASPVGRSSSQSNHDFVRVDGPGELDAAGGWETSPDLFLIRIDMVFSSLSAQPHRTS
jgi:hypothetical protein